MATDALAIENMQVFYGQSCAVEDLSLRLRRGTVLALLGRNGAGKSTSLNALAGLLEPRGKRVEALGRSLRGLAPESVARLGVRLVPQGRRVFPNLTVQENLQVAFHGATGKSRPWNLGRVGDLFGRLRERMGQRAGTLSGGEQQMLAIGRALMGNPEVLLMDEPSEGLAPMIVDEVSQAIAALKAEKLSILLVEQNFKLALSLADDVVVLNTGLTVLQAPAEKVRREPELVTRYLGVF